MRKIKLEHSFLVFLYAYLRHIDLSLDRSRWNGWTDYVAYARGVIEPAVISTYLQGKLGPVKVINADNRLPEHSYLKSRLLYLWRASTRQNNYLTVVEACYVLQLLARYSACLRADFTGYTLEQERLRVDIAVFYNRASQVTLSRSELDRIMQVEHFWQNATLTTIALQEYSPSCLARAWAKP